MIARDGYFDNVKFVLIALVVTGHLIEPLSGEPFLRPLYLFIYAFHIPLFVLVSGYFSKNLSSGEYTNKVISKLVIPYFIFETLYSLFDYYVLGEQVLRFSYFTPYWLMWFLFSMILWKVALPYAVKIRYALPLSIIVAILAGYANDAQYYASISRTLVFFPFFLAGYYLDRERISRLQTPVMRGIAVIIMMAAAAVMVLYGNVFEERWLFGSVPYEAMGHPEWTAGLYRAAVYAGAILLGGAVLALVPERRISLVTAGGRNTLYVYMLHGFIIKYLAKASGFYAWFRYPALQLLLPVAGVLLTLLLSGGGIRGLFKWMVEPKLDRWFKKPLSNQSRTISR
ncbi:acyltransferase family protein [Paenibacillus sp. P96]|uniref:Acyltransferase family protein n=1 Tax=Paenibacillus zeirhizosphaerae TaxID=2987519 RepID=A0ABT9FR77_9BACL|nr:acyltransferase family protein [Paenibacillus sp. P96]MDP4097237.1 acyltransferase family protein [Paenibacillus sp. P96]